MDGLMSGERNFKTKIVPGYNLISRSIAKKMGAFEAL